MTTYIDGKTLSVCSIIRATKHLQRITEKILLRTEGVKEKMLEEFKLLIYIKFSMDYYTVPVIYLNCGNTFWFATASWKEC